MGIRLNNFLRLSLCVFMLGFLALNVSAENQLSLEKFNSLKGNAENGKDLYLTCALCHTPEGWGTKDGYYPQLSGQHSNVLIKQLIDIKLGNRDVPTMIPFSDAIFKQSPQQLADLIAYISKLPMSPINEKGNGTQLETGKKLYQQYCLSCHGTHAEGDNAKNYPLLQGQHYHYLLRQMQWIKNGQRKNGDAKMKLDISAFNDKQLQAVADYISRIKPDKNKVADSSEWKNEDFPVNFVSAPWKNRSEK